MRKLLILLPVLALTSATLLSQTGIKFDTTSTWQTLVKKSGETGKLIFIDCYTSWCGPCKGMAKEVFPDKTVGDFMNNNFICTKRDMEKGEGITLHTKYKKFIPGFPTYLLINSKEEVVYQVSGFMKADKFIESMKQGLAKKSWIIMKSDYVPGKSGWNFMYSFAVLLETAYQSALLDSVKRDGLSRITIADVNSDSSAFRFYQKYAKNAEDSVFINIVQKNIARKYRISESEISAWAGKLFQQKVKEYFNTLTTDKTKYDPAKADNLLANIRAYSFNGREQEIVNLLMYNAAYKGDAYRFFNILEYAQEFGLNRYKGGDTGSLMKSCFGNASKEVLSKCLEFTGKIAKADTKFTFSTEIRNYAFFLEKCGDKEEAVKYNKMADEKDEALRKEFEKFMKK